MLRTKRLLLRAPQENDADALFEVYGDADVMKYWSSVPDPDVETTRSRLAAMAIAPEPRTYFVLEHDKTAIGAGGVHERDEIGFILNKRYWRQGFMTEAMCALIPWLFSDGGFTQLTADADPNNTASVACLKSLGFKETGFEKNTFCVNDVWSDSVYFTLQRPS